MATSVFFNNFASSHEQSLIEDLVIESIRIHGLDVYYIPRLLVNEDKIYGESTIQEFNHAYTVEMYVKNVEGFQGQGDFLSKFNLEIRDQMTLTIARRTFASDVGNFHSLARPREGDLIYFPLNKKMFHIQFVEHESVFYQMGALQMYDLQCELFEYSNEIFRTGVPEIDRITDYSLALTANALLVSPGVELHTEDGYPLLQEGLSLEDVDPVAENDFIQTRADQILDFTEKDPFSEAGMF